MQKVVYVFILIALTTQWAFAQQTTVSSVSLKNGSVVKGRMFTSKTSDRIKVETPDGSIVFFTKNAIKEVVKEEISVKKSKEAETTVYLRNGSVIHGTVTNLPDGDRMKIETPTGSLVYFTERSVENMTQAGEEPDMGEVATTPTRQQRPQQETSPVRNQQPVQDTNISDDIQKTSGYKGFLDFGYGMKMGDISTSRIEIMTSHGYQLNPYFFMGVGAGVNLYSDGLYYMGVQPWTKDQVTAGVKDSMNISMTIPIFADFRFNFTDKGNIIPFAGLKLGYSMGLADSEYDDKDASGVGARKTETKLESVGLFASPSIGAKIMVSSSFAINMSFGYTIQTFTHYPEGDATMQSSTKNNGAISIRLGLEF